MYDVFVTLILNNLFPVSLIWNLCLDTGNMDIDRTQALGTWDCVAVVPSNGVKIISYRLSSFPTICVWEINYIGFWQISRRWLCWLQSGWVMFHPCTNNKVLFFHFGPYWNISAISSWTDMHGPQRINPADFTDCLLFPETLWRSWQKCFRVKC